MLPFMVYQNHKSPEWEFVGWAEGRVGFKSRFTTRISWHGREKEKGVVADEWIAAWRGWARRNRWPVPGLPASPCFEMRHRKRVWIHLPIEGSLDWLDASNWCFDEALIFPRQDYKSTVIAFIACKGVAPKWHEIFCSFASSYASAWNQRESFFF